MKIKVTYFWCKHYVVLGILQHKFYLLEVDYDAIWSIFVAEWLSVGKISVCCTTTIHKFHSLAPWTSWLMFIADVSFVIKQFLPLYLSVAVVALTSLMSMVFGDMNIIRVLLLDCC